MNEQWIKWESLQKVVGRDADIDCISFDIADATKLRVFVIQYFFRGGKIGIELGKKFCITFDSQEVYAYRETDESFRQMQLYEVTKKYGDKFFFGRFFRIRNSEYIQWLSQQSPSHDIDTTSHLEHFIFVGANMVLDVIASNEPTIEEVE